MFFFSVRQYTLKKLNNIATTTILTWRGCNERKNRRIHPDASPVVKIQEKGGKMEEKIFPIKVETELYSGPIVVTNLVSVGLNEGMLADVDIH